MRGQVLGVDRRTGDGIVTGEDGRRYSFKPDDWAAILAGDDAVARPPIDAQDLSAHNPPAGRCCSSCAARPLLQSVGGGAQALEPRDPRLGARLLEQFGHRPDHRVGPVGTALTHETGPSERAELVLELGEMTGQAGSARLEAQRDRLGPGRRTVRRRQPLTSGAADLRRRQLVAKAVLVRLVLRIAKPIPPKPRSIIAHVEGSGTAFARPHSIR